MLIRVLAWLVLLLAVEAAGRVAWTPAQPGGACRFLSPDPLGRAASPSLYDFAHGDPVNAFDPDGRFGKGWNRTNGFSSLGGLAAFPNLDAGLTGTESGALDVEAYVYWLQQRIAFDANLRAYALEQSVAWMDPYLVRAMGGLRAGGGALMMLGGFAVATGTSATGFGIAGGLAVAGKGADEFTTGITHVWTGEVLPSTTEMWLRSAGMTPAQAAFADAALTLGGSLGSARILAGRAAAAESAGVRALKLPATDGRLLGSNTLGYTTRNGKVFLQPGMSRAEQVATMRHESVHAWFSPRGNGQIATFRQNLGQWAYDNSQLLRFIEEAIAETYASRSLLQGLRHPMSGYGITRTGLLLEGSLLGGGIYGAYQLGTGEP